MKRLSSYTSKIYFAVLFVLLTAQGTAQNQIPIKVMTYNIRLDVASDGENAWDKRKESFASMIRYHKADVVGLQEAFKHQVDYLIKELPEYGWFGVGRDDGKEAGEFMAILYRKERFDTLQTSTFWCSQTPEKPSLGWDAAFKRVVTWGKMYDKNNKHTFYHFNTHLDHLGKVARKESAKLLISRINAMTANEPVVITGDFNSPPSDEPYQAIIAETSSKRFFDTYTMTKQKHHGPVGTFNAFDLTAHAEAPIDYIFVSKGTTVLSHATNSEVFNGRFPSDHFAVSAEIILNNSR